ncbi:MAG: leucyl aminopeptidase family protein [Candidatus Pacebacteria bacterium]|nr:leucyl aminopeptidase family protein [Candidatus Paceibacterota bacterium]
MTKIKTTTKDISGAHKKYCRLVVTEDAPSVHRLVECKDGTLEYRLGAGKWKDMTPRGFIIFVRTIVQAAQSHQIEHLALQLSNTVFPKLAEHGDTWMMRTLAENLTIAAYEFTKYKTSTAKQKKLTEVLVCGSMSPKEKKAFTEGRTVGEYTNQARDIANTTGDDMTPSILGKTTQKLARGTGVKVTIFDHKKVKKDFPALWAVGKGADDLPCFILMEYYGAGKPTKGTKDKKKQPIALVGKGITYDSGGLNVKPAGAMHEMHLDMSGGAAVIASIVCAAKLGLKKNIVAVVPAAENSISDRSMRAGDIIGSHAGKTIEVIHTDAEGRLVLADGISYVTKYNPRVMLDVATLTGASLVALGQHASACMTKDAKLEAKLKELGEESGDYTWPLPLWDEYKAHLKSTRADIANMAPNFSRWGGCIEGGTFLSHFAPKDVPWAHIDMAPRMDAVPSDKLAKGATGEPVRLLVRFLEQY